MLGPMFRGLMAVLLALAPIARAADPPPAPPSASDVITVTATRTETRLADTPSSVVVLSKGDLASTAAATVDDALRQVPGFTLFRRSGSRTANPTSQGVSLRGIGASGASRALVLDDGIPLNDPFGGWIYWGRVPRASLERVEVLRGGASDLYGSAAMGGVIQFIRRDPSRPAVVVDASAGSERTGTSSLFAAGQLGAWRGSLSADLFSTDGYVLVTPSQRGAVDTRADTRHTAVDGSVERVFGNSARFFLRAAHFDESRHNGTQLQTNDTAIRQLAAGAEVPLIGGALGMRGYFTDQSYAQTFSAIAADRNSERLTVDQRVPSRGWGGSVQWSRAVGMHHALLVGGEGGDTSGRSDETSFAVTGARSFGSTGGVQRTAAFFAEDLIAATPRLAITAGLRFDSWRNFDGFRNALSLPARRDTAWSPRLSLLYRAGDVLSLTASAYRAFRAPVLNELYRSFRVGNVLTQANEALGPERLSAVEAGARLESRQHRASLRATLFSMTTSDTIANVTLSSTPALITRQRQNLGGSRSRGAELEGELRPAPAWRLSAGYLLSDAVVTSGSLAGKQLPQVPRNQGTLQATWSPSRSKVGLQTRWSGRQYDDDLNQLPLRSYFAADLFASRVLTQRLAFTVAAENLFDRRIETAATPVITLATPRTIRIGFRYER
jgi:outer membrane receptor protein involved in Fe transport